jgi:signal transduction histidine kinase
MVAQLRQRVLPYIPVPPLQLECVVLHDFLATNRTLLIERCRLMVATRPNPKSVQNELVHGIPVFLDQLIGTLAVKQLAQNHSVTSGNGAGQAPSNRDVSETATLHGRDLLANGFTIEQVVRDYGDLCQAVTHLAFETGAPITADEFHTFNHCLDDAIAGAVTEYAKHSALTGEFVSDALNSRLGPLAHELRNHLYTATLVVAAIRAGNVGISGATGAVLDRSLLGMRGLIDRALAEVRVNARVPPRRESIKLVQFFGKLKLSASFDALARGTPFTITPVADDLTVYAEPEMLASAVGNLLQNAFKFTKHHTEVRMCARVLNDRVLIDVEDQCGGLPAGAAETMFLPFSQNGDDRSGLGLGLDISRRIVEANGGDLTVRNMPGTGCVFTISLPRHAADQAAEHR